MRYLAVLPIVFLLAGVGVSEAPKQSQASDNARIALSCLEPLKPLLPLKPLWCTGTWTQVLMCDQSCNCSWEPMCLE